MSNSFSTDIVAKLNDNWLPDEAGTSCLFLMSRLNKIQTYWLSLTENENKPFVPYHWTNPPLPIVPNRDPDREHEVTLQKVDWLRVRLPAILKRLGQPGEWCAFLEDVEQLIPCYIPTSWTNHPDIEVMPRQIEMGIEGLKAKLLQFGQSKELPDGWEIEGWQHHRLGLNPIRNIPDLIFHLRSRVKYVTSTVVNYSESPENRFEVLQMELRNARRAIRFLISDPKKRPIFEYDPASFQKSLLQLESLIDQLSVIAAEDVATTMPGPENAYFSDDDCVSVKDVAGILVDVSEKTLRNVDANTWGNPLRKTNRNKVWRWGDIKEKVAAKRMFKKS
jgi:hypothetical protein